MAYCNRCGRYIDDGLLCSYCMGADSAEPRNTGKIRKQEETQQAPPSAQIGDTSLAPAAEAALPCEVSSTGGTSQDEQESREESEGQTQGQEATDTPPSAGEDSACATPGDGAGTEEDACERGGCRCVGVGARCAAMGAAVSRRVCRVCRDVYGALSTQDTTAAFSGRDIREHRRIAALSYLWILWFVPFFGARSSRYVRYHLGQGVMLLLLDCLAVTFFGIATLLGGVLSHAAPAFAALGEVALLLSLLLKIFGVVSALRGRARELPLLGNLAARE